MHLSHNAKRQDKLRVIGLMPGLGLGSGWWVMIMVKVRVRLKDLLNLISLHRFLN